MNSRHVMLDWARRGREFGWVWRGENTCNANVGLWTLCEIHRWLCKIINHAKKLWKCNWFNYISCYLEESMDDWDVIGNLLYSYILHLISHLWFGWLHLGFWGEQIMYLLGMIMTWWYECRKCCDLSMHLKQARNLTESHGHRLSSTP